MLMTVGSELLRYRVALGKRRWSTLDKFMLTDGFVFFERRTLIIPIQIRSNSHLWIIMLHDQSVKSE